MLSLLLIHLPTNCCIFRVTFLQVLALWLHHLGPTTGINQPCCAFCWAAANIFPFFFCGRINLEMCCFYICYIVVLKSSDIFLVCLLWYYIQYKTSLWDILYALVSNFTLQVHLELHTLFAFRTYRAKFEPDGFPWRGWRGKSGSYGLTKSQKVDFLRLSKHFLHQYAPLCFYCSAMSCFFPDDS